MARATATCNTAGCLCGRPAGLAAAAGGAGSGNVRPLARSVVDALRAAHAQGIVHRDLKPSNILVDAEGRARVMDFGIAARLDAEPGDGADALAGCIVGTPGYLSPEAAVAAAPSVPPGPADPLVFQLLNEVGIVSQLSGNRAGRLLDHGHRASRRQRRSMGDP
jgi:hypothetical protein